MRSAVGRGLAGIGGQGKTLLCCPELQSRGRGVWSAACLGKNVKAEEVFPSVEFLAFLDSIEAL